MESATDKPMSSVLQAKHDPSSRHRGQFGHTSRRRAVTGHVPAVLERSHAPTGGYFLTEFEVHGCETSHSYDRALQWVATPNIFADHALSTPTTRRSADGLQVTTAQLPPVAVLLPDRKEAEAEHLRKYLIYAVTGDVRARNNRTGRKRSWRYRVRGLRLWAELSPDPPENLMAAEQPDGSAPRLLPARLSCATCRVPQTATVRMNGPECAFSLIAAQGRPLDIDLGKACVVAGFSTQGRHPPTRDYPRVARCARDGWVVEGRPDWDPSQRYSGPTVQVLAAEADGARHRQHLTPQWVSRYELRWRGDGGRTWRSLGTFEGNSDATTEVAHLLDHRFVKGGLVCRYLRFVPLEWRGGGAVRVGVYGQPLEGPRGRHQRQGGGGTRHGPTAHAAPSGAADEGPESVTYTLTQTSESYNPIFCREGSVAVAARCRCSYCPCHLNTSASARRHRRRRQAAADVRAVLCEEDQSSVVELQH